MFYRVGTWLSINGLAGKVIGYIQYENPQDIGKTWIEYRLKTANGECWLSCDEDYNEYSVSWPANDVRGQIGAEWHKVDEGTQVVRSSGGDVDVDPGERASFIEYEDLSEDHTLSVEIWSDGTEFSKGEYIEKSDIEETGYEAPPVIGNSKNLKAWLIIFLVLFPSLWSMGSSFIANLTANKSIDKYVEESSNYTYQTSITGSEKQNATVYAYYVPTTTDDVAKDIIQGIEGNTESVTQKDNTANEEIAILTDKEYCLVYHPEGDEQTVYVQVSDRKYNYTSDNAPYRSSSTDTSWYRSHYYSSGYSSDSSTFGNTPSAYSMYDGATIHDIGNGYFDSYSSDIRQESIRNRQSSTGGGK